MSGDAQGNDHGSCQQRGDTEENQQAVRSAEKGSGLIFVARGAVPTGGGSFDGSKAAGADSPRFEDVRFGYLHPGDRVEFVQKKVEVHGVSLIEA
jgi:hypothetical protein